VSGAIKINVTLRVVTAKDDALALVRFRPASSDEAFQARVQAEVARQMAPVQAELAKTKQAVDVLLRERADRLMAERLLKRNDVLHLSAHERNNDNVIVHVERAAMVGDDGYLFFEVENRSNAPYRVARAQILFHDKPLDGLARLFSAAIDKDPAVLGVVPAGTSARGVVVVRSSDQVRGKDLALEVSDPTGRGAIQLTRGIVLK
jgi:hypothetical protein